MQTDYDAVVIGSGPNGLAAAIAIQQQGLRVLVIEGSETIGGGMRTRELTLPGFRHDLCSAVHPLGMSSPFFKTLPLEKFGLQYLLPKVQAAHPLDNGPAAAAFLNPAETAATLGQDADVYQELVTSLLKEWPSLSQQLLGPLRLEGNPLSLARFGLKGLQSAQQLARKFKHQSARALFAGMAAHAIQPLTNPGTAAFGLVLLLTAHASGWPVARGGSQSIADALGGYFTSIGGTIVTGQKVKALNELPSSKLVMFDTSPDQLVQIAGHRLSSLYKWQLSRYKYGMGCFKVDWALDGPIPFTDEHCRYAGTIHLGNTLEEITEAEHLTSKGRHPEKPYVLLSQPAIIDTSRAPAGKQTVWAYCHVPNGSTRDMTKTIEMQVERYAPGFRDRILGTHTMNTEQLQQYNPNYVGGDINGGEISLTQLFTRPALRGSPYRTSAKGLYICSASTPPGGGVHGMCGFYAARRALRDIFRIEIKLP